MRPTRAIAKPLALLAGAALALALPTGAAAAGGRLDTSFGSHGRLLVPAVTGVHSPLFAAAAPGSKTVIATSSRLVRVDSRGRLDRSFGDGGAIDVPAAAGAELKLSGLAVDEQGRIVLAGTSDRPASGFLVPRSVVVERLLEDGRLDPSFGAGGRVETSFGLPAAPEYETPSVEAGGVTVDARGRPVVTGGFVTERRRCETYMGTYYEAETSEGFVARLTRRGNLDPRFGQGGVLTAGTASFARLPLVDRAGRITYSQAASYTMCPPRGIITPSLLRGLDPAGEPRAGFDAHQSKPLLFADAAAQDAEMRTVLLGTELSGNGEGREEVVRVEPTGRLDRSFGTRGHTPVETGVARVAAMTVDPRDRVLLAGSENGGFYLGRLDAHGEADPRFGSGGSVRTRFGKLPAEAEAVTVDSRGRIVVAGGVYQRGSHQSVLALARYVPGSGRRRTHR